MRLEPGCPRCSGAVTRTGSAWSCATHEAVTPLWRVTDPDYNAFAEHLVMSRPLPTWLPWPLPEEWKVTDFGCVTLEGSTPLASYVSCSGSSDLDGAVEVTVVTEEPGVGLGARCGGVGHSDPGREVGEGVPPTRIRVDGAAVPLWAVSTAGDATTLDRAVLAGEAQGRWIWLVLRPASAALLLHEMAPFQDVSGLGVQVVGLPFGRVPRAW